MENKNKKPNKTILNYSYSDMAEKVINKKREKYKEISLKI